jgi:excisionase family DNA binding protein
MDTPATTTLTITKAEAARLLGLHVDTVRLLVRRGSLREITLGPGTRPRLVREEVERLAREGAP